MKWRHPFSWLSLDIDSFTARVKRIERRHGSRWTCERAIPLPGRRGILLIKWADRSTP